MSAATELEPPAKSRAKDVTLVAAIVGTSFLNSFFSGALTSSLPSIGRDLGYSTAALSWPVSINALVLGAFLLPFGRIADIYSQRLLWLIGTFLFAAFSLGVSLAPTSVGFTAICALLGLGSAAYVPAGVGVLGSYFEPGPTKNRAFAALGAGQPLGFLLGLVVGALLSTTKAGWRASFYVQAGLTVLFWILGFRVIPSSFAVDPASIPLTEVSHPDNMDTESTHTLFIDIANNRGIDYLGAALSIAGLSLLTFALAMASSAPRGWKTPYIPPLIPVSALLLAAFVSWEVRMSKKLAEYYASPKDARASRPPAPPLLAPSIWKAPHVSAILAIVFLSWAAFNSVTYFLNLLLQLVLEASPIKTALYFLPMVISGFLLNFIPGMLLHKVPGKAFVAVTMALSLVSPLMMALVTIDVKYWPYIFPLMATAPMTDLIFSLATVQISKSVSRSEQAIAGALFNVVVRISTSVAIALFSSIGNAASAKYLASHPSDSAQRPLSIESPEVLLVGYKVGGWLCFAAVVGSLLISVVTLRDIGVVGKKETKDE